ncbi:MAG: flavin reductase family protein, partial [Flavobacteriaceae bacterium]|nr:flavin reductase family protein [Flavobacteriaceae bacterium]
DKKAKSNDSLQINDFFVVNILSESQEKICYQFANSKLKPNERFKKVDTKISKNNIKIISESCSFIECKITEIFDGGDHFIYLGLCVDGKINDTEKKPLIYHKGKLL